MYHHSQHSLQQVMKWRQPWSQQMSLRGQIQYIQLLQKWGIAAGGDRTPQNAMTNENKVGTRRLANMALGLTAANACPNETEYISNDMSDSHVYPAARVPRGNPTPQYQQQ